MNIWQVWRRQKTKAIASVAHRFSSSIRNLPLWHLRLSSLATCSSASGSEDAAVCVSYWLNLLQNLPPGTPDMFVTLNPPRPPATGSVLRRLALAHPVFGPDMVAAQAALPGVQVGF